MPGFRRHLSTRRRRKPDNNPVEEPDLRPMFVQANQGPVPHLHHGEPGAENDPGLKALDQIFIWIKGEVAILMHAINREVLAFNTAHPGGNQLQYDRAVKNLKDFVNTLNDETSLPTGAGNFGPTINFAEVEPILDGSGFYTSARVIVQWQGGTHSDSSMIHVP